MDYPATQIFYLNSNGFMTKFIKLSVLNCLGATECEVMRCRWRALILINARPPDSPGQLQGYRFPCVSGNRPYR